MRKLIVVVGIGAAAALAYQNRETIAAFLATKMSEQITSGLGGDINELMASLQAENPKAFAGISDLLDSMPEELQALITRKAGSLLQS